MDVKRLLVGFLVFLLLSGCLGGHTSTPTATLFEAVPSETVIITRGPTRAVPTRTPTLPPLLTATATKVNMVQAYCPLIEPASSLPEIDGQLIMNSINHDHLPDSSESEFDYLHNLKTGIKQSLSTKSYNYIELPFYLNDGSALVSPDRSSFAYVEYGTSEHQNPELRIVNSAGEQEPMPGWGEGWDKIYGWADNQTLLFTVDEAYGYGRIAAVRPFEEGATTILEPPQNLDLTEIRWYVWFGRPILLYNPGLKRAVYMSRVDYPQPGHYTLWDPKTNVVLWQKPVSGDGFRPVWSPDGTQFAVAAGDENQYNLFLVSEEGKEQQITDLSNAFGIEPIITTGALDWSPEGQRLAFWIQKPNSTIAWIDLKTKIIHEYCIEGQPFQLPIWSPDGQWLALNSPLIKGEWNPTRVILLNILTNRAYELISEDKVIGWMQEK